MRFRRADSDKVTKKESVKSPPPTSNTYDLYRKKLEQKKEFEKYYKRQAYRIPTVDEGVGKAKIVPGSIGLEELSPELREYLGLPENLERKECPRCEQPKLMDDDSYLCKDCR